MYAGTQAEAYAYLQQLCLHGVLCQPKAVVTHDHRPRINCPAQCPVKRLPFSFLLSTLGSAISIVSLGELTPHLVNIERAHLLPVGTFLSKHAHNDGAQQLDAFAPAPVSGSSTTNLRTPVPVDNNGRDLLAVFINTHVNDAWRERDFLTVDATAPLAQHQATVGHAAAGDVLVTECGKDDVGVAFLY